MDSGDILSAEQASERGVGVSAAGRPKPSPLNQRRKGRSSLRYRFMLLQLGISACLMGLMLYLAAAERRVAMEAAEARVEALASLAAQQQTAILEQGRSVLAYLAESPELRAGGAACDAYLARFKQLYAWISSLRLSDLGGDHLCASRTDGPHVAVGDRDYFREALARRSVVISDPITGRVSGRPTLVIAMPVLEAGEPTGVVTAGIDLAIFGELQAEQLGGLRLELLVLDRAGRIIANQPPRPELVGRELSGWAEEAGAAPEFELDRRHAGPVGKGAPLRLPRGAGYRRHSRRRAGGAGGHRTHRAGTPRAARPDCPRHPGLRRRGCR